MNTSRSPRCLGVLIAGAALVLLIAHGHAGAIASETGAGEQKSIRPPGLSERETFPVVQLDTLRAAPGWPLWLKDYARGERTEKTSAIAFAGRDAGGDACFFLADEVGFLRFCRVHEAGSTRAIALEPVRFDDSFMRDLGDRLHWNFAALAPVSDPLALPDSLDALLSIEGEARDEATRVLRVRFVRAGSHDGAADEGPRAGGAAAGWRVISLGDAFPGQHFWDEYTAADRGLKGLAVRGAFTFLGLDYIGRRGDLRLPGSLLYVYDGARNRAAELSTADYGIYTIGAADAPFDSVTVLIDHARMCLDILRWDYGETGRVSQCYRIPLELKGPGGFRYGIPNVEGVAVDDAGDLWCVTDPQFGHYRAFSFDLPESVHVYMEAGIPMLYRFPGAAVWQAAGLSQARARRAERASAISKEE